MFPQVATLLKENKGFYLPFLLFVVFGTVIVSMYTKVESFLWLNQFYSPLADVVFPYATHLGDGKLALAFLVGLSMVNYRLALTGLYCFLLVLVLTQLGKLVLFEDVLRPAGHFRDLGQNIRLVEGVQLHFNNSFPSGHSASAFALFSFIAISLRNKGWGVVLFGVALFAAYSRIYLAQHFFNDVYVGSIIGVMCTLLMTAFLQKTLFKTPKAWHNKGLLYRQKSV